jgi:hypothetical protein
MINFFLRRVSRYLPVIKALTLAASVSGMVLIIIKISPTLPAVLLVSCLVFITLALVSGFFFPLSFSVPASLAAASLLFLRVVDLLTPLYVLLLLAFVILLAASLRKTGP